MDSSDVHASFWNPSAYNRLADLNETQNLDRDHAIALAVLFASNDIT
jgi:hypothetical protein